MKPLFTCLRYSLVALCAAAPCAFPACQQESTSEPPLQPPAPLGQQARLFQQRQIDKARGEAVTHTFPANEPGSNQINTSNALPSGNGALPAASY